MFAIRRCCSSRFILFPIGRTYCSEANGYKSVKSIKLKKKLASTILFGSTLLVALYCKKRRKVSETLQDSILLKKNDFYKSNLLLYNYKNFILPSFAMKHMDELRTFNCRENDIFVVSFPKTGTTWLQEIIYCIMHEDDFETSSKSNIEDRFPYLEFIYPGLAAIDKMPNERLIKTHLPFSLLPADIHLKKPKILYVMRNPKDVTTSYYHFLRMFTMSSYTGTFDQFAEDMIADQVPFGPMWKHYQDIWTHKGEENVLIVFYEDLHKDIVGSITKIAKFLGKSLQADVIQRIADHCSFVEMANNPNVNYKHWDDLGIRHKHEAQFMRKGEVGDWKNYFSDQLDEKMNAWIDEKFCSLKFTYNVVPSEDSLYEKAI